MVLLKWYHFVPRLYAQPCTRNKVIMNNEGYGYCPECTVLCIPVSINAPPPIVCLCCRGIKTKNKPCENSAVRLIQVIFLLFSCSDVIDTHHFSSYNSNIISWKGKGLK